MQAHFERIFESAKARGLDISAKLIGERPCMGDVDLSKIESLKNTCQAIIEETAGVQITTGSSSTDCNIPLSLGVPALCIGVYSGGGTHTREEWVEKVSLPIGLLVGIRVVEVITKEEF